jgi:hypothetical protein
MTDLVETSLLFWTRSPNNGVSDRCIPKKPKGP